MRSKAVLSFVTFALFAVYSQSLPPGVQKKASVAGITEYEFPNGLRVLLYPNPASPKITVNVTYLVGSRHEGYGETGMAHLLEHMNFIETTNRRQIKNEIVSRGAAWNGTTSYDRTNYFETVPATDENLNWALGLETDRMVNVKFTKQILDTEMTVVRNEFERGENSPASILRERVEATAYLWHNYGKSTIGNRSDIERVPVENLRDFYKRFYQPDNAMLVVAGKYDEKKALDFIVKYFGALKKPQRKTQNTYTDEPAQDGERQVNLRRVGTVGVIGAIYHIPAGSHTDFAAVQVLEDCLTSEPAGRVYKALVETKKATSVSGSAFAWHDPGVVEITAKVETVSGIEGAREALTGTIEGLEKMPITEDEVNRSKLRFQKYNEQLLSSSDRFAVQLSEWAGAGDWRLFFLHRDRLEKVTAADVNRVALKYLTRNNRTVGMFVPTEKAERVTIPETPEVAKLLEGYKGRASLAVGEAFDTSPENIDKRVVRGTLGNLKTAFLEKKTRGEIVDLRLNFCTRFPSTSAMYRFPSASNASMCGILNWPTPSPGRPQRLLTLPRSSTTGEVAVHPVEVVAVTAPSAQFGRRASA